MRFSKYFGKHFIFVSNNSREVKEIKVPNDSGKLYRLLAEIFRSDRSLSPPNETGKFFKGVEYIVSYFKVRIFPKD